MCEGGGHGGGVLGRLLHLLSLPLLLPSRLLLIQFVLLLLHLVLLLPHLWYPISKACVQGPRSLPPL